MKTVEALPSLADADPIPGGAASAVARRLVRVDLHVHTADSWDSILTAEQLRKGCAKHGIGAVAITDHNKFGAHEEIARRCPELVVIPGEEITSRDGHIIGLFLKERIPPRLSAADTIERIRAQGGVVYVPHPFVRAAERRLRMPVLNEVLPSVDVIEVWNGRGPLEREDRAAEAYAREHDKAPGAGSDCHSTFEVGSGAMEVESFDGPDTLVPNLRAGRLVERRSSLFALAFGFSLILWGKLRRRVE